MAEIVQSLFGVTPQMYQQQQANQADARALQIAQLRPFERSNFAIGRGVSQLVGALGGQDPQLQMLSRRNQIAQQIDFTNPESINAAIRQLGESGDTQGAMMLAEVGRKAEGERALVTQRIAAARASDAAAAASVLGKIPVVPTTNEITNARAFANSKGPPGSPEYDAAFIQKLTEFTNKPEEKSQAFGAEAARLAKSMFNGKTFDQLTPLEAEAVNKRIEAESASRAPRISLLPSAVLETSFSKGRGTDQSTALRAAIEAAQGGAQALSTVQSMQQLDAQGRLFTGPLATGYVGATNLLASLGLLSPEQTRSLTTSQIYDKQAKDLVMQDLGGKLGAQISDADRKFVEARIPQITTSEKARTELLSKLAEIQQGKINYFNKMNAHANEFGNLNKFNFSQSYAPPKSNGWSIKPAAKK